MDKEVILLIKNMLSTCSPKEQQTIILEYLIDHPSNKNDQDELLSFMKNRVISKSEQGKQSISKRDYSKSKKKIKNNYGKPKFFADYKGGGECDHCKKTIGAGPVIRHKSPTGYLNWCVLCPPPGYNLSYDKDYIKWSATDIDVEIEEKDRYGLAR
jgi:hypothetical protein